MSKVMERVAAYQNAVNTRSSLEIEYLKYYHRYAYLKDYGNKYYNGYLNGLEFAIRMIEQNAGLDRLELPE